MRVIIAGSRSITRMTFVRIAITQAKQNGIRITEVVSGRARGVDTLGEMWARAQKPRIPIKMFPADWEHHPKMGGFMRNQQMAGYADALIAIRKDKSSGTTDMINRARVAKLLVYVLDV